MNLDDDLLLDDDFDDSNLEPWGMNINQFSMFMHLAQLSSFIVPLAGIVLPIVMWSQFKNESRLIDEHGRNIINWIISSVIYAIISAILIFVLIGIPLLIAVGILSVIFSIIGAVRANDGIVYRYPLSINFMN